MAESKRSLVVHEVLAFIQFKLGTLDQVSLTQILSSSFSGSEILDAKKMLAETAGITLPPRDGGRIKDMEDIFKVLLETDSKNVPMYVAHNLDKLPFVTFDHVNITKLLQDFTLLKTDVAGIRMKLDNSEQTVSELKKELSALRHKNVVPTISPQSAQNVNVRPRRGVTRGQATTVSNSVGAMSTDTDSQGIDRPSLMTSALGTTTPQPATIVPSPAPRAPQKKSYAQMSRQTQPPQALANVEIRRKSLTQQKILPVRDVRKTDVDGFVLVERKRRPKASCNQRGTATPSAGLALQAVEPTISIYISRLDPTTTEEGIRQYVDERSRCRIRQPPVVVVHGLKRLESARETNFKSYVLRVAARYKDVFLAPDFWTAGIVYRRYREAKPTHKIPN